MKRTVFAVAGCFLAAFGSGTVMAQETGLAGMHAQHIVNGRLCFDGHTHVGTGSPGASKQAAIVSAVQDWSSFTTFEYGNNWGSWNVATAKKVKCEPASGRWACEVQAVPCHIGTVRRHRQARR